LERDLRRRRETQKTEEEREIQHKEGHWKTTNPTRTPLKIREMCSRSEYFRQAKRKRLATGGAKRKKQAMALCIVCVARSFPRGVMRDAKKKNIR